jgi:hypothetical protein
MKNILIFLSKTFDKTFLINLLITAIISTLIIKIFNISNAGINIYYDNFYLFDCCSFT